MGCTRTHPLPAEYLELDVRDETAVAAAAADGIDAIVNCSVLRHHPRLSFDVNVRWVSVSIHPSL